MSILEDAEGVEDTPAATDPPAADEGVEADSPADWDGDVAALDKQPWWASVPEKAQQHLKDVYAARDEAKQQATYLDKLFSSDDAVAEVRKELEGLKQSLGAKDAEFSKLKSDYDKAAAELEDTKLDRSIAFFHATYPDIMADVHFTDAEKTELDSSKGAFPVFVDLINRDVPHEKAAKLARAMLTTQPQAQAAPEKKAPPAPRAVEVPLAVRAMSKGGPPSGATSGTGGAKSLADALQDMAER